MTFPRSHILLLVLTVTLFCVFETRRRMEVDEFLSRRNTDLMIYQRTMAQFNVSHRPMDSIPSRATSGVSGDPVTVTDSVPTSGLVGSGGIITWKSGSVGWVKLTDKCDVGEDFVLGHLRKPIDTPIYVYKEEIDVYVSGSILKKGMWEDDLVERLRGYLSDDPDLVMLDIGANVGVFSLMAAQLGRKVFSVDCLTINVRRLCASVSAGNFVNQVTIIHNAMSNTRENVTFGGYRANIGATYVKKVEDPNTSDVVMTILLDDLLGIYPFKKVMIKMDVEAHEAYVFKGGEQFFSQVQVDYLLMEFKYHRGRDSGQFVVDFLYRHNMVPVLEAGIERKPSSLDGTNGWPDDVLWVRKELESKISPGQTKLNTNR